MNLNNLNLNEKIEDLLAALKKKEDENEFEFPKSEIRQAVTKQDVGC